MALSTEERLRQIIARAQPALLLLDPESLRQRPGEGKWSPIEILGHLIDSAANNHQRFVRVQQQNNLVFNGYQQDRWVEQQNYQEVDWTQLVSFWTMYNQHLARVIEHIPAEIRNKEHPEHNLDRIAFHLVPAGQATTLEYLMADYVDHLLHHLKQLLPQGVF